MVDSVAVEVSLLMGDIAYILWHAALCTVQGFVTE